MSNDSHEPDYQRVAAAIGPRRNLGDYAIEIIRMPAQRRRPEHVVFDFDGTLSLIREGWPEVMVPMMVEVLGATGTRESSEELYKIAHGFVMQLNGKQTIYQMIRLGEEVSARGGRPEDPQVYKQRYHDLLMRRIESRHQRLRDGQARPVEMLVPHSLELLEELQSRGAQVYLASGTDLDYVQSEARLLGLDRFFGPHIYGALADYKSFSKAMVIQRILAENRIDGELLLGFGDGYVEIQNIKSAGGTAVAVASDEAGRSGKADEWKRDRLVGAGADVVIPDYHDHAALLAWLWNEV
ncbi:MAG: HAD family hydrolase [Tepidisphaerales bacterium]